MNDVALVEYFMIINVPDETKDVDFWMNFGKACGDAFIEAYIPIVEKRKDTSYHSRK